MSTVLGTFPAGFWVRQLPTAGASLLITELLYKFHSFTLETAGFLTTWYVLDAIVNHSRRR
jgi:hypothetical protein